MSIIVTATLNGKATEEFSKIGKKPDFSSMTLDMEGAEIVRVFGKGKYAELKVDPGALEKLRNEFGNKFVFAEKRLAHPF